MGWVGLPHQVVPEYGLHTPSLLFVSLQPVSPLEHVRGPFAEGVPIVMVVVETFVDEFVVVV